MKNIIVSSLVLGGLFAFAFAAHADDGKLYVAALCQEDGSGETGAFHRNEARVTRVSSVGSGRLICPITRDDTGRVRVNVFVTDNVFNANNAPESNVRCAVSVRNFDGSPITWNTRTTSGASPSVQTISPELGTAFNDRPYSVECVMPTNGANGSAALHAFKVTEIF